MAMPILPDDFLDTENADSGSNYDETHGLPARVMFPDSNPPGTLLIVRTRMPFRLSGFKSDNCGGVQAITKDAYVLWRLSERYGRSAFSVGLLDQDRVKRLWQLRAIEFDHVEYDEDVTRETLLTIRWDRMPLRRHYERLVEAIPSVRNDENTR
jgi:hypothetical protein